MLKRYEEVEVTLKINSKDYDCLIYFDYQPAQPAYSDDPGQDEHLEIFEVLVEPAPELVIDLLDDDYKWLLTPDDIKTLEKAAIKHVKSLDIERILDKAGV